MLVRYILPVSYSSWFSTSKHSFYFLGYLRLFVTRLTTPRHMGKMASLHLQSHYLQSFFLIIFFFTWWD
ncbi:hypothetical protein F4815DRAFT_467679 [Daldinia loculata]|nr:hypothetical protein F4815DRAFT_467679 [Daldinia loculata]